MVDSHAAIGSRLVKIHGRVVEYLALAGGLLAFVMSALTTGDVIGREAVNKAIPGCFEIAQYLMIFVIFFAIAYLESKKGNVRVEIIAAHFPKRLQVALSLLSSIVALFIFGIILYSNGIYSWESWVAREGMYGIKGPLYLWKFGIPLGCFFMCIELLIGMGKTVKHLIREST
jgi:TRAP-type C4-dicarboxylate transport system permease small subunit